ncbi:MAG: hypothetical protein HS132_02970 [Planctomycetia bacterium]|nr:hypothetical protein [Planctomycetia bacterium]
MKGTLKVRKQFILDPAKIEAVKKITESKTDTEAINKALDMVIANSKVEKMLVSIRGKGNIKDVYHRVSG